MTQAKEQAVERVANGVYLAARFSRRHECHALAKALQAKGYQITSRWVKPEADHVLPTGISAQAADDERRRFATEDVADVQAASWTISLMEEPRSNTRGGRHIEFGIALALGHRLTIIGPRETVFHHLPQVEHFDTIEQFTEVLSTPADGIAVEEGWRTSWWVYSRQPRCTEPRNSCSRWKPCGASSPPLAPPLPLLLTCGNRRCGRASGQPLTKPSASFGRSRISGITTAKAQFPSCAANLARIIWSQPSVEGDGL
jgi:hypothetical protein